MAEKTRSIGVPRFTGRKEVTCVLQVGSIVIVIVIFRLR
jgi:hypothetical protein